MAKWNFAAVTAVAVLALPYGDARAQTIPVALDGCAVLARTVYEEVLAAAYYGPGNAGPWYIGSRHERSFQCDTVARTVSRAFTSAMANAGFDVRWDGYHGDRGDFCLSMFLSQCYPNRRQGFSGVSGIDDAVVLRSWTGVSHTIMRQMANPYSSDEVRFDDDHLRLRLGLTLRSVNVTDSVDLLD